MNVDGSPLKKLPPGTLAGLRRRRLFPIVTRSIVTIGLYAVIVWGAIYVDRWFVWLSCWPLLGVLLFGFSCAAHECVHRTYAPSAPINRAMGTLWLMPLLLNYPVHEQIHLKHHRYTGTIDDPEFMPQLRRYAHGADYIRSIFARITILKPIYLMNWRFAFQALLGHPSEILKSVSLIRDGRVVSLILLAWAGALCAATVVCPWFLISSYWIPVLIFGPAAGLFFSQHEHYAVENDRGAHGNTSTMETNSFVQFLVWNINHHTVHHLYPVIPFYNLPKLTALIQHDILHRRRSFFAFHWKLLRGGPV
jgi:fatty acid desaturase